MKVLNRPKNVPNPKKFCTAFQQLDRKARKSNTVPPLPSSRDSRMREVLKYLAFWVLSAFEQNMCNMLKGS